MDGQHDQLKDQLLEALYTWIRQRPGLEFGNYGDVKAYRQELRGITQDLHHARQLLRAVDLSSITGNALLKAFDAYCGRMEWKNGKLEYCTGQYWPTEYRRVVCAIAASALWNHYREDFRTNKKANESDGDAIRRKFKQQYGKQIAARWFN